MLYIVIRCIVLFQYLKNLSYIHCMKTMDYRTLWVKPKDDKSFFIIQKHPDSDKVLEDFKWLNEHSILTPDKKILNHVYEFNKVSGY